MKKVLIFTNRVRALYIFRKELVLALREKGYGVCIAAPRDEYCGFFQQMGCEFVEVSLTRRSIALADFGLFFAYRRIVKKYRPDLVLTYSIKPHVFGGLACRLQKIPYVSTITGLGSTIQANNVALMRQVFIFLYRLGIFKAKYVFCPNDSIKEFCQRNRLISKKTELISVSGSGVNLDEHPFEEFPAQNDDKISFLFVGRLMVEKGVGELIDAILKLPTEYAVRCSFTFVGDAQDKELDEKIELVKQKSFVQFVGYQKDVKPFMKNCQALLLPSYHEGMANVLLEAAATGRVVLTSKIPGCRESFDEGVTGFGFDVKNVDSLVKAIKKFIETPYALRKEMGIRARRKMEREFDRKRVTESYLNVIDELLKEERSVE